MGSCRSFRGVSRYCLSITGLLSYRPGTEADESGTTIKILNYDFSPQTLRVPVGATVTWTNMDTDAHNVLSGTPSQPTSLFQSTSLNHQQSFSHTFNTPGTYAYYCGLHPFMTGTIVVE